MRVTAYSCSDAIHRDSFVIQDVSDNGSEEDNKALVLDKFQALLNAEEGW